MTNVFDATKQTVVFDPKGEWDSEAHVALVLDAIFEEAAFKEAVLNMVRSGGQKIANRSDLVSLLRQILRDGIGFESQEMNSGLAGKLMPLVAHEAETARGGNVYNPRTKKNPAAVFWPNPIHKEHPASIHETLPVIENLGLVDAKTPIGSAGSCFAVEIAQNLIARGFNYVVKEKTVDLDRGVFVPEVDPDDPPVHFSCNWGILFNSPSFAQIAEKAFGVRALPRIVAKVSDTCYIDPFRQGVMFTSVDAYEADYERHIEATRDALLECKVFVITLGLNECWELVADGSVLSRNPNASDFYALARHQTLTVAENVAAIQRFIDVVRAHNPDLTLIVSVSPVPFLATGRADTYHVIAANTHSKSVLRVAAEELAERNRNVHYFPSYEVVTVCSEQPWQDDQRHVAPDAVAKVMKLFDAMFVAE